MIDARTVLDRLVEGNRRFASNVRSLESLLSHTRREQLAEGQNPIAIIVGCSDSRVPAEVVFDQGLGDLFVIRVAGHVVAPSQIGSVEFAADRFGTRLVVVLGHSQCGAVQATVESLQRTGQPQSEAIRSIVDRIRPGIASLLTTELASRPDALLEAAVRANVRAAANQLRHGSSLMESLVARDGLLVVGAEYSLATGVVEFFDGLPVDL